LRKRFLALFLLVAFVLLSYHCLPVIGHSGDILSAWAPTPPNINGFLVPGEWASADTQIFPLGPLICKIYVMNDANNLYLALEINDPTDDALDLCSFYFDNDHDDGGGVGAIEDGDNSLSIIGPIPGTFSDMYFDLPSTAWTVDTLDPDPLTPGTWEGSGALNVAVGFHYFEFSHPLDSADDVHDFSLSIGDTVGFTISYWDNGAFIAKWPGDFPDEYGDIVIASSPAPKAVGGEVYPVDKLSLLAPYIATILVIATTAVALKKRIH